MKRIKYNDLKLAILFVGPLDIADFVLVSPDRSQFSCKECGSVFKDHSNCRRHVKTRHFQEQPVPCPVCGVTYKNKNSLNGHLRAQHGILNIKHIT